jgi:hypothetical protein
MVKGDNVLRDHVAAVSCGIYNGAPVLDLDYAEDSEAETDANFVMTGDGRIIEVQGTAEKTPFSQDEFLALMGLAKKGIAGCAICRSSRWPDVPFFVMPGFRPGIHVFNLIRPRPKTWMAGQARP